MKLSDVMGAIGLSIYAELGLVLFLLAFVLIAVDLLRSPPGELERARTIPLDDEHKENTCHDDR